MFFNKEEVATRVARRNRKPDWYGSTIMIHSNTRCKLSGFLAVGPLYQHTGLSWFDIRVRVGSPEYFELDTIMKELCRDFTQYGLKYQEVTK